MHPALSIIVFTTCSGAGYGLLFLAGLAGPLELLPPARWLGFTVMALALGLVSIGLLASTLHLGHPERAWRALSQWRSSWLSREGVAAVATFVPAGLYAIGWVFLESLSGFWALCGLLAAAGAVATVACTGMIYASLATIRQWHQPLTLPLYLLFALTSGALFLTFLLLVFGQPATWCGLLALVALAATWGCKLAYWRSLETSAGISTPESATGLGALGRVRLLDPPHTEENYLQREMGFRIARKHADKLRRLALLTGCVVPLPLLFLALLAEGGLLAPLLALVAAASGSIGVVLERWLFFAEARHTVMLYYGVTET